ncbi:UNVERIFIED_CONTAM: hypothetical protein IGO34_34790, partial [Salmonella enterica subsp. enterica serovar Weltevreden]
MRGPTSGPLQPGHKELSLPELKNCGSVTEDYSMTEGLLEELTNNAAPLLALVILH